MFYIYLKFQCIMLLGVYIGVYNGGSFQSQGIPSQSNNWFINNEWTINSSHTLLVFNYALKFKLSKCFTVVYAEIIKVLKLKVDTHFLYETWPQNDGLYNTFIINSSWSTVITGFGQVVTLLCLSCPLLTWYSLNYDATTWTCSHRWHNYWQLNTSWWW